MNDSSRAIIHEAATGKQLIDHSQFSAESLYNGPSPLGQPSSTKSRARSPSSLLEHSVFPDLQFDEILEHSQKPIQVARMIQQPLHQQLSLSQDITLVQDQTNQHLIAAEIYQPESKIAVSRSHHDTGLTAEVFDIENELQRIQQFHQHGAFGNLANTLVLYSDEKPLASSRTKGMAQSVFYDGKPLNQMLTMNHQGDPQKVQTPRFDKPLDDHSLFFFGGVTPADDTASTTNVIYPVVQPAFFQNARLLNCMIQRNEIPPRQVLLNTDQVGQFNDISFSSPYSLFNRDGSRRMRGGVIEPFPEKLHRLLTEVEVSGRSDIISFVADGRAFAIHKPDVFFKDIVPQYFRQSRFTSFKRQLNLYSFEIIDSGDARGGYFHELFVKDQPELCRRMRRVAVKMRKTKGMAANKQKNNIC